MVVQENHLKLNDYDKDYAKERIWKIWDSVYISSSPLSLSRIKNCEIHLIIGRKSIRVTQNLFYQKIWKFRSISDAGDLRPQATSWPHKMTWMRIYLKMMMISRSLRPLFSSTMRLLYSTIERLMLKRGKSWSCDIEIVAFSAILWITANWMNFSGKVKLICLSCISLSSNWRC